MTLRKLSSTDAFVVVDLPGAPSAGIVRCAPKILQGGAEDLARSQTYAFAMFAMRRSGASAGINAAGPARDEAISAFVAELAAEASFADLVLDAGKGVTDVELEGLSAGDGRSPARLQPFGPDRLRTYLAGLGPAVAAEHTVGLQGRTVAIEGFDAHCPALVDAIEERGGRLISISTSRGTMSREDLGGSELRERWDAEGPDLVGADPEPGWAVFGSGAQVLFAGSKMGAVGHETAGRLDIAGLVPHQPLAYTARALAVLQGAGTKVVADFVATAAPLFADWPAGGDSVDEIVAAATTALAEAVSDTSEHPEGAFLGACYRAEAFLSTWQDSLPFGRPLAG